MSGKTGIKVFAPAAIANFGAGLSILSMAVDSPGDELIASFKKDISGIEIESIIGYKKPLSIEKSMNSAALGAQLLLDHLNEKVGISLKIHKKVPLNSGFSSNASSAVAGVFAVNELLGRPLERYDLLPFAEKAASKFNILPFPAQVCSILYGGIILYENQKRESFQKLYTPHGIHLTIISPDLYYTEQEKLSFLKQHFHLNEYQSETASVATMVTSLFTSNFELFSKSIRNNLIKEQLKHHYPWFEKINNIAIQQGAFGCGFAGIGPGIFIASPNSLIADEIERLLPAVFKSHKLEYRLVQTNINLNGVYKF